MDVERKQVVIEEFEEEAKRMGIDVDAPVFDVDEAIDYIAGLSDIPEDVIGRVLELEEEYMRKIGIVVDLPDKP